MEEKIKILLVEDIPSDAELIGRELKKGKINCEILLVDSKTKFINALEGFLPDIILSDHTLPFFDSHEALRLLAEAGRGVPFILITATMTDERAVEMMKEGANDYILKDRLQRLPLAVTTLIEKHRREVTYKNDQQKANEKLLNANRLYSFISQINQNIVHVKDKETLFDNACRIAIALGKFKMAWIGLFDEEAQKINVVSQNGIPAGDLKLFNGVSYQSKGPQDYVMRSGSYYICNDIAHDLELENWKPYAAKHSIQSCMVLPIKKNSTIIGTFNLYATELDLFDGNEIALLVEVAGDISFAIDIFEKAQKHKETEELIIRTEHAIKESNERYVLAAKATNDVLWDWDTLTDKMYRSENYTEQFGYRSSSENVNDDSWAESIYEEDKERTMKSLLEKVNNADARVWECEYRFLRSNGELVYIKDKGHIVRNSDGKAMRMVGAMSDISNEKLSEEELLAEQKRLKEAQSIAHLGNWDLNFADNVALFSEEACRIYGLSPKANKQTFESWLSFIHPEDLDYVMATNAEAQRTLSGSILDHRIILEDGTIKHIHGESKFKFDQTGRPTGLYGISHDVTERKLAELERTKITNDLIQRNKDLEQFAYIISHNLRAPVANILGASGILNYHGLNIEEKAMLNNGINESVAKLDEVIKDLNLILQTRREIVEIREKVIFSKLLDDIKISIKNQVDKDGILITCDFSEIDELLTLKSYLYSIFYNLISNGVKYRQPDIPLVMEIKSRLVKNRIELLFSDNGMGIDLEKNGEQVFGLYKRFHASIEGKGMGLFMVKTQVETLGGKISIKSEVNKGTEFKIEFET